jgi:hypothetical protein
MTELLGQFFWFIGSAASIWFIFWSFRKQLEVDLPQNRTTRLVRWTIVALTFLVARFSSNANIRVGSIVVSLAFIVWPNFSVRLTRIFGRSSDGEIAGGPD